MAYARDGALKTSSTGQITTSDGLTVGSGFQPIPTERLATTFHPMARFRP